jgi:serine/threonine protein kinase/tetratricopeptide (TPR) repeat protein
MVGQMIDHYRIIEEIGRGGMGIVYKALDTKLNRPVAIKSLQARDAQDEAARKRFLREAMMVARLDHPYICKVYEILEYEGESYIVLEFVRGRSLRDLAEDPAGKLPLEKVLDLGREIAEALEEAHKNGIIHRDIKPGNIMLLESGHIKVLDFGLAKALRKPADSGSTAPSSLTGTGQIMGTLSYMSPEQITGKDMDPRSDIFSFGIVLFEMIAGRKPFSGNTAVQVAASIMIEDSEPLHRYRKGVPGSLDRVIQRMLEKDPSERYQSVHEVWVELRHIREELVSQTSRAARLLSQAQTVDELPAEAVTVVDQARQPSATSPQPAAAPVPARRWWLQAKSRQWALGFMSALGMIAVVLFILWYQSSQPALSFAPRDWVLISDFENLTGDSIFDKSLATALNVSISQSTHANIFSKARTYSVLQRMGRKPDTPVDEQIGREICQRQNIRGLICPSIGRVGNKFVITARIVNPQTGDGVRSYAEQAGDYNQVLSALDGVAASLRKGLGESLAQVRSSRPLGWVTTTSLSALKSFSEAQYLWAKGQYGAAVDLYQSALKEDPEFAMAHAALGVAYSSHVFSENSKAKVHYEKSISLADRTTEREKMTIQLQYESRFGKPETARTLFENYLRAYPDDISQRYNYAGMLRERDELDKAVEQYKEVIRVAPDFAFAHVNLATTYSEQERLKDALASYDRAFQLEPTWVTSGNLNHEYGFALVEAGEYEKARKVFEQGLSTSIKPTALRSLALLDLYQGKYHDAKAKLIEALLLNVSSKALLNESRNHLFMYILLEGEGDSRGVQQELDKAAKCLSNLSPQTWLSSRIGVGYSRSRSVEKAARILEWLRKEVNSNDPKQNSDLHRLEGEIEIARGNQARGLELLMLADRDQRSPLTIESLARAQQIAGKRDDAILSYEAFLKMRSRSDGWEPQQYWFAAHVNLAGLYLARKEEEKARQVLREFLTLWKSADTDLPLNKEALRLGKILTVAGS